MFDSKNLHHAYIIEGDREQMVKELKKFLEKELKFSTQGNPDFYFAEYDKFGVDQSRELVERQQQKSWGGAHDEKNERLPGQPGKIFVLATNSITREAQNSLLKIFEEPTVGTHFFLIVPSAERLLSTLLSRALILKAASLSTSFDQARDKSLGASAFLKATPAKRLEMVKEMLGQLEKEEMTKSDFLLFLNELEALKNQSLSRENASSISELLKMRSYLQDQSSSAKLILEYLALTL